jgi:hypothetical protein
MDGTLRGAPSEGQVTDPRVMREVLVTAVRVIPRPRAGGGCPLPLERALALMAEPPTPLVARSAAMALLRSGGRRWRDADRCLGNLASALGQADPFGAVLDEAQHLEAQALHGGERRGWRRRGDAAQDLVFLDAQLQFSFSSVHDPTNPTRRKKRPPNGGESGGREPTGRQVRGRRLRRGMDRPLWPVNAGCRRGLRRKLKGPASRRAAAAAPAWRSRRVLRKVCRTAAGHDADRASARSTCRSRK